MLIIAHRTGPQSVELGFGVIGVAKEEGRDCSPSCVAEGYDDDVMAGTSNSVEDEAAELGVRVWCDWGCTGGGEGLGAILYGRITVYGMM